MDAGSQRVHTFYVVIILALLVVSVGSASYWLGLQWREEIDQAAHPIVVTNIPPRAETFEISRASAGIGGELYDQVSNPIQGEIPDTAPPVTNPVDELYKNPFE